jgi:hypothetical protein
MASFFTKRVNLSTTSFVLVEKSDFDRSVTLWTNDSACRFGFVETGISSTTTVPVDVEDGFTFVLPANHEVWVEGSTTSTHVSVLVSGV